MNKLFVDRGDVYLHMCADTMGVLGTFIGNVASVFKPPNQGYVRDLGWRVWLVFDVCLYRPPEPKRKREPAHVSEKSVAAPGLLGEFRALYRLNEKIILHCSIS